jgi:hypothetical protein
LSRCAGVLRVWHDVGTTRGRRVADLCILHGAQRVRHALHHRRRCGLLHDLQRRGAMGSAMRCTPATSSLLSPLGPRQCQTHAVSRNFSASFAT